jgi:hypothetical protein
MSTCIPPLNSKLITLAYWHMTEPRRCSGMWQTRRIRILSERPSASDSLARRRRQTSRVLSYEIRYADGADQFDTISWPAKSTVTLWNRD